MIIPLIIILLFPAFSLYLEGRNVKFVKVLSPVFLCYLAGILLNNSGLNPGLATISHRVSELSIGLAIPILLFSSDFLAWIRLAKKTISSFLINTVSVTIACFLFYYLFGGKIEDSHKIAAMLSGVYTGGTANMAAIGMALDVDKQLFILVNAADVILGGVYLLMLFSFLPSLIRRFLPPFEPSAGTHIHPIESEIKQLDFRRLPIPLLAGILVLLLSAGITYLIDPAMPLALLILLLTSSGILFSFFKKLRNNPMNMPVGSYALLVFSTAIGSMVNISEVFGEGAEILLYTAFIMFMSILLHFFISRIFRIDADTSMITSTAGIFGPPFVPPIARVLKNNELLIGGIAAGLLGYAIGNYLGIGIAFALSP